MHINETLIGGLYSINHKNYHRLYIVIAEPLNGIVPVLNIRRDKVSDDSLPINIPWYKYTSYIDTQEVIKMKKDTLTSYAFRGVLIEEGIDIVNMLLHIHMETEGIPALTNEESAWIKSYKTGFVYKNAPVNTKPTQHPYMNPVMPKDVASKFKETLPAHKTKHLSSQKSPAEVMEDQSEWRANEREQAAFVASTTNAGNQKITVNYGGVEHDITSMVDSKSPTKEIIQEFSDEFRDKLFPGKGKRSQLSDSELEYFAEVYDLAKYENLLVYMADTLEIQPSALYTKRSRLNSN